MTRSAVKRAAMSATFAAGLSSRCQTGRAIFATCFQPGSSSCASIQSRTFARASGLRRRWISATIPPITTTSVPNANSPRDT